MLCNIRSTYGFFSLWCLYVAYKILQCLFGFYVSPFEGQKAQNTTFVCVWGGDYTITQGIYYEQ